MSQLQFKKVDELPSSLEPNTVYFMKNEEDFSLTIYTTDKDGNIAYSSDHADCDVYYDEVGGRLWGAGDNQFGVLGTNNTDSVFGFRQTVAGNTNWLKITTSGSSTYGIKSDNTLWVWGSNNNGQLGTNNRINRSSPVQTISGGSNWDQINAGQSHAIAIKTDGTLWVWGDNFFGQLGTNDTIKRSSPVQTISGGNNWVKIATSHRHSMAIKTDGTLWLWGDNIFGQLGTDDIINRSSPVQIITGESDWSEITTGSSISAGIKNNGSLWSWGRNNDGTLGDGTFFSRSSPVQVAGDNTNWYKVAFGIEHTIAIKNDNSYYYWGRNTMAQSGDGSIGGVFLSPTIPESPPFNSNQWVDIACGDYHTLAIDTSGQLWGCGSVAQNQFPANNIYSYSDEYGEYEIVVTPEHITNVKKTKWLNVCAGDRCTFVISDH